MIRFMLIMLLVVSGTLSAASQSMRKYSFIPPERPARFTPVRMSLLPLARTVPPRQEMPVFNGIPYKAFFCRMEVKTVKKLGVWLKVHAGDYDNYMRPVRRQ